MSKGRWGRVFGGRELTPSIPIVVCSLKLTLVRSSTSVQSMLVRWTRLRLVASPAWDRADQDPPRFCVSWSGNL